MDDLSIRDLDAVDDAAHGALREIERLSAVRTESPLEGRVTLRLGDGLLGPHSLLGGCLLRERGLLLSYLWVEPQSGRGASAAV